MSSLIAFFVIQLPAGGYVTTMASRMLIAGGKEMTPELEQQLREQYGLDEPVYVQYVKWIGKIVLKGDFGYSLTYRKDARDMILERLPMTFAISLLSVIIIWAMALPIGIYSAMNKYSWSDYLFTFIGFIGLAAPNFLLALILMFLSQKYLGQAMIGLFSPEYASAPWSLGKLWDLFKHL